MPNRLRFCLANPKNGSVPLLFQNELQGLEMYKMEQAARIQSLMEDNSQLKRTIANGGLTTPPPTLYPASLQVRISRIQVNCTKTC